MMKFKKFLAAAMTGAMMFGTVAMAVPAVSAIAADATTSKYTVSVDYEDFTAYISTGANEHDAYIVLEVCKDSTGTKVSNIYTYEDNGYGVTVDLSFLKASKDSYIRVYGSSETVKPTPIKINAQPAKISLKYSNPGQTDENAYKAFEVKKGDSLSKLEDLNLYEYRTLYGSTFESLKLLDQKTAEVAGTTIIVRQTAKSDEKLNGDGEYKEEEKAPASAEVKVKIPAAPKAPKVKIDYAKGSIKLPKNVEVQVLVSGSAITKGDTADSKWQTPSAQATDQGTILGLFDKKDDAAKELIASGFTLVVRTKASGKKGNSNPAIVPIKGSAILAPDGKGAKAGTSSISWKEGKDKKGTAGFEISTSGSFEYLKSGKWTKLKAPFFTTDSEITVRVAGDKAKSEFPSQEYKMSLKAAELKITGTAEINEDEVFDLNTLDVLLDGQKQTTGVTWTISDGIFEVKDNKVMLKQDATYAAGSHTLTATVGEKTATITLTAKPVSTSGEE